MAGIRECTQTVFLKLQCYSQEVAELLGEHFLSHFVPSFLDFSVNKVCLVWMAINPFIILKFRETRSVAVHIVVVLHAKIKFVEVLSNTLLFN